MALFYFANSLSEFGNMPNEQVILAMMKIDGEKPASTRNTHAAIIRHGWASLHLGFMSRFMSDVAALIRPTKP
jgi:hypothetical protein